MEIKLLSCPLCLKPHFDGVDTLRTTLIAAATSHISCPVCNESLVGLDKLTIHLFSHISNNIPQEKPPISIINNEPKPIEAAIENVETQKEKEPRTIRCDICNFSFSDENILDMHQKLLHQTLADKDTGAYCYHCHLCSKKFKMRGSLMVHLRVAHYGFGHNSESSFEKLQGVINAKESAKSEEKIEEPKGNPNKQWSCDVCSKLFTTKYFLKKHKRLHTGEMPYFCAQCNKYFTFQQSYHKHMLYHSSEKPHVCSECGRAFKELSTLHNHERIHSGERPFACETCGKCFRQRVSYLVHRRIHTGAMPYKCTACEKTFRYKVSQRSHKCTANPPGTVVKTNVVETTAKPAPCTTTTTTTTDSNMVNGNLNTIIVNAEGQIIGQNFAFDGNNLITYASIPSSSDLAPESQPENFVCNNIVNEEAQECQLGDGEQPDFFTMVLSPPLPNMESLCLSNSMESSNGDKNTLQTINEESLKELLYGQHTPG